SEEPLAGSGSVEAEYAPSPPRSAEAGGFEHQRDVQVPQFGDLSLGDGPSTDRPPEGGRVGERSVEDEVTQQADRDSQGPSPDEPAPGGGEHDDGENRGNTDEGVKDPGPTEQGVQPWQECADG